MNIIVRPHDGRNCYCRPDTTWERENKDFYVPDLVDELHWAPIVFVRISKAGKCIGEKFVGRYYDSFNFGMLIYTGAGDIAFSSCTDHTSLLPSPLYDMVVMESTDNTLEIIKDGSVLFKTACSDKMRAEIEKAVMDASRLISLRIGDFVALELAHPAKLTDKDQAVTGIKGIFCESTIFEKRIIF